MDQNNHTNNNNDTTTTHKDNGNFHSVFQGSGHYDNTAANTCNGFKLNFEGGSGATKVCLTIYGIKRS